MKKIRVLITEDSATMYEIMKHLLESDPEISVIGWAKNGVESIKMTKALKPNVITMDIHMPIMDGLETTKRIMEERPTSILIVSSIVSEDLESSFSALKLGALDVMDKSCILSEQHNVKVGEGLINRIKIVAKVRPFKKVFNDTALKGSGDKAVIREEKKSAVLAIGASTGGPAAINFILKEIPAIFPFPILITQHIARGFIDGFTTWLKKTCSLKVKSAEENEEIRKGTVYVAPDDLHMGVSLEGRIILSHSLPIAGHRPSVDFMLETVASCYGDRSMGVILTGMGQDGAKGMLEVKRAGGVTISQDEATSVIFGMPKAAIKNGAASKVCPIDNISREIIEWGNVNSE